MSQTQNIWKKPLLLAVILTVLGGAAYWLEFKRKPEVEEANEQSKKILSIKDKTIASVHLIDSLKSLQFKCLDGSKNLCKPGDNSKWEIAEPLQVKADGSNIHALLSSLSNLTPDESINLKEESPEKRETLLKEYGLSDESRKNPNFRRIELKTADDKSWTLFLGSDHPIGGKLFAGIAENGTFNKDRAFVIPTVITTNFNKDFTHWRDKKILSIAAHEVSAFELQSPKGLIKADRQESQWTLSEPTNKETFTGDIENIDNLLSTVSYLNAKGFTSEKKKDADALKALKNANRKIKLTLTQEQSGEKITLEIFQTSGKDQKTYLTTSHLDPLFEVENQTVTKLDKGLQELRLSKLITSLERFSIKKIEFAGKPIGVTAKVLGEKELGDDKIQVLLDKLSGNRIQEFIRSEKIPTGSQDGLTIKLGDEKNPEKRAFIFWKNKDQLYAQDLNSKRKEAFKVDKQLSDALPWDKGFFEKK